MKHRAGSPVALEASRIACARRHVTVNFRNTKLTLSGDARRCVDEPPDRMTPIHLRQAMRNPPWLRLRPAFLGRRHPSGTTARLIGRAPVMWSRASTSIRVAARLGKPGGHGSGHYHCSGRHMCIMPIRVTVPHDVSGYFDFEATCLHLRGRADGGATDRRFFGPGCPGSPPRIAPLAAAWPDLITECMTAGRQCAIQKRR